MGRTLVALDDSPQAQNALEYALSLHDGEFVLLYVIDYSESITDPGRGGRGRLEGWYQKATEDAEDLFAEATAYADEHGVSVTTVIADGKPAEEIIHCADEHDVDQIVMGSHGRTGVARVLLGSVAEQVVRRSDRPTTVVH